MLAETREITLDDFCKPLGILLWKPKFSDCILERIALADDAAHQLADGVAMGCAKRLGKPAA